MPTAKKCGTIFQNKAKELEALVKRFLCGAFAALLVILSFSSCARSEKVVMTVSGAQISEGLFAYYFDKTVASPLEYGLSSDAEAQEFADKAVSLCTRYVASNTMFSEYGLSLTNAQKLEITEKVNNYWVRYENHYEKIGVTRDVLNKVFTAEAYEDSIFTFLFDFGRDDAEAEKQIKEYFAANYVVFKTVSSYFTATDASGSEIKMTQAQKEELVKKFKGYASAASSEEAFITALQADGLTLSSTVLLKKGQSGYPQGFFEKVIEQDADTVQVISFEDYVFAVWKYDSASRENEYESCRTQCLKDMYRDASEKAFAYEENGYEVVTDEGAVSGFISRISDFG